MNHFTMQTALKNGVKNYKLWLIITVNPLTSLFLRDSQAVARRSAPLRGTPFIWRTPRVASSVPSLFSLKKILFYSLYWAYNGVRTVSRFNAEAQN
jgi:hypothetical protein